MKRERRLIIYAVMLLIIMPVCLSGCWDSHELNKLSIVAGAGYDVDPGTGELVMIFQSIVPSQIKNSSGGGGEQKGSSSLQNIQLDSSSGSTAFDAINRFTQHVSRSPFYQHSLVNVLGNDAAQQGIYRVLLETFARNPASRPLNLIAVSETKASDVLEVQDSMESIQIMGMAAEIKLSAQLSRYPAVPFLDFMNRFMSKTTAPIAPVIGVFEEIGPEGKKIKRIRINGTAVFRGDKMIGKLNERESSGLLWAINKTKKGFVTIPEASLEIVKAKSKIVPELQGDKIKITITIKEESNLVEYTGNQNMTTELLQELEKRQSKEIESQVMAAVEKSFSLDSDIFGFGEVIHRKYKREWQDLKSRWDKIYPDIEVMVKVKSHLNEIGDVNNSLTKYQGAAGE